tara:strand:- start:34365 stop:35321 length:957 start_codon:yes stop_codon:yes gene_type:complete
MRNNGIIAGVVVAVLALLIGAYFLFFRSAEPESPVSPPVAEQTTETPEAQAEDPSIPTFDTVRVDRDGSAVMAGRALPGAKVEILANGEVIATATADSNGEWVVILDQPLTAGSTQLSLRVQMPDGETKTSTQVVAIDVPESPDRPALVVLSQAGKASRILQGPGVPSDAGNLVLQSIDYDERGNLIISGKSDPRAPVRIYVNGSRIGDTYADEAGQWELRPVTAIEPGQYTMRIDQIDEAGKVIARIELPFERGEPSKVVAAKQKGQVVIQPGNNLWGIAQDLYGSGFRYTVIYEANKDQIRDPDLIYPGQVFATPQ